MNQNCSIMINNRPIGNAHPPYVIAELSGNHNGSLQRAFAFLERMQKTGVDAVKLQTYTADTITIDHDGPEFQLHSGLWAGRTLYDLYQEAHTPWEWHEPLFRRARELGLTLFSTPFDFTAIDLLQSLDAPAYKIASLELIDLPLIARAAQTGKPLILSTGAATLSQIAEAVMTARNHGCQEIAILKCTSEYPAPPEEINLRTIPFFKELFDTVIGLSDHSLGIAVPVAAVSLGASMIEKHVTLDRAEGGVDSAFSLDPEELEQMIAQCRTAWQALGTVHIGPTAGETNAVANRRSLYVVRDMVENEPFSVENVRSIRPGHGLPPKHLPEIIGRRARRTLRKGTALKWEDIQ
ncbi:MAG: pseudaminic acid synthase [Magnetococcales bacterium]|nr:pseudaminic acid synthase [Magnetococcales bacterium]MBF0115682.1 pseudaminic acid synthase [Magnetococcales bacterium]